MLAPQALPYLPYVILHIAAGGIAVVTGYTAVAVRKGERVHRAVGTVFVFSMLFTAGLATYLAVRLQGVMNGQKTNIGAGILAAYLAATAYTTVKRRENTVGRFETVAAIVVAAAAALFLLWGIQASSSAEGTLNGQPASAYFVLALIAALLALADRRMIRNGGLSGRARIARHLWRMCFAFFFAAGSFFLGQQRVMPSWMQGAWYLYVLGLTPLALIAFWLIRVRVSSRFRARRFTS